MSINCSFLLQARRFLPGDRVFLIHPIKRPPMPKLDWRATELSWEFN